MKFLGIIPSRYASTRFPGKPLADMKGKPMIQRVYEAVKETLDEIVVATDDERILNAVHSFGGNAVMTSPAHKSGTDRCFEAYKIVGEDFDVVINIQGDEPFIDPCQIELLKSCFDDKSTEIATLVIPFNKKDGLAAVENPNSPKVILDNKQRAIYFSRSVIPYVRGIEKESWMEKQVFYKHIGLYAYRVDVLSQITGLPQSSLEIAESLEQLRWLENGFCIRAGISSVETVGIDTPDDLKKALALLR